MRINNILPQTNTLTIPKVRIIARLKGDGSVFVAGRRKTNYYIKFFSKNETELERFREDIKTVYGLKTKVSEKQSGKNPLIKIKHHFIRSKLSFEDLKKYGPFGSYDWRVPKDIKYGPIEIQKEFIKTFAEDEGTVILKNPSVRIYSVNLEGLKDIQKMLENLGIETGISIGYGFGRNVFGLVIKRKSIHAFGTEIGFLSDNKNRKLNELIEKLNN